MDDTQIFEIAKGILANYESEDFKSNYVPLLVEDTHNIAAQVKRILQRENDFSAGEQSETITEYILENYENHVLDFSGYHVGDMCVSSVTFGEQHVCFSDLSIPRDNWEQATIIFERLDFTVNGGDAFYIVDGGVKLDLDSFIKYDYEDRCFVDGLIFCG